MLKISCSYRAGILPQFTDAGCDEIFTTCLTGFAAILHWRGYSKTRNKFCAAVCTKCLALKNRLRQKHGAVVAEKPAAVVPKRNNLQAASRAGTAAFQLSAQGICWFAHGFG